MNDVTVGTISTGDITQAVREAAMLASISISVWDGQRTDANLLNEVKQRHGKANPAKAAVARKILIAAWHVLSRNEPFKPSAASATDPVPASSSIRLAA